MLVGILTSLFFFPFEFKALPGINTKMMLAVVGLLLLIFLFLQKKSFYVTKELFHLSMGAFVVSVIGLISVTYNNTPDYAYATYLVSMWVWLSGAFVVVSCIKGLHGKLTIPLVVHYLVAVCVFQCIAAQVIDHYPGVKQLVDSYIEQNQDFLNARNVKRLYGIGASLDVAGSRFAAVLVMMTTVLLDVKGKRDLLGYLISYMIIAVLGNMIARTTTVGIILSLGLLLYYSRIYTFHLSTKVSRLWKWTLGVLLVVVPLSIYQYNASPAFKKDMRFAFEGFFSLAEKGEWDVSSNEKLKTMVVFPEELKTWVIGDGYFDNPYYTDINYTGKTPRYGYYMDTDVGYLRFIFYFGIIGLLAFSAFIIYAGWLCREKWKDYQLMFLFLIFCNFVVWLKVSTDIFLVFALFVCASELKEEEADDKLMEA